jgi:hypothetical protein
MFRQGISQTPGAWSSLLLDPLGREAIVYRNAYTATKLAILWIPLFSRLVLRRLAHDFPCSRGRHEHSRGLAAQSIDLDTSPNR